VKLKRLSDQACWTAADAAELDLVAYELARALWLHKTRCADCAGSLMPGCALTRVAMEAALEWREGRILRSKAQWLRVREQARQELELAA
jgi:hypothetical protein